MKQKDEDHGRTHDHDPKTGQAYWYGAIISDDNKPKPWPKPPKPPKDKESSPKK